MQLLVNLLYITKDYLQLTHNHDRLISVMFPRVYLFVATWLSMPQYLDVSVCLVSGVGCASYGKKNVPASSN